MFIKSKVLSLCRLVLYFLIFPLGTYSACLLAGFGWSFNGLTLGSFIGSGWVLVCLIVYSFESGYKSFFKQSNMKTYFYIVFAAPCVVATIGFLYALTLR